MLSRRNLLTALAGAVALASAVMTPAAAQEPKRGGTMTILITPEPPTLMIGINQTTPTAIAAGKIYESLLRYDFDLKPMPGLAKSWIRLPRRQDLYIQAAGKRQMA